MSVQTETSLVGKRIRHLRTQQGLRLEDLARRAGYTKGFISKIENGKASPPIATLMRVAEALGVAAGDLFGEDGDATLDPTATLHVRPDDRTKIANADAGTGYDYFALAARRRHKMMEPYLLTVYPDQVEREKTFEHPGEEFIYVLKGRTDYKVGDEVFALEPGDSLYFDATKPHAPWPKDGPVTFLAVFCAPPTRKTEVTQYGGVKAPGSDLGPING